MDNDEHLKTLEDKIDDASKRAGLLSEEEKAHLASKRQDTLSKATHTAGIEFAAAIIFSTLFGIWLDKKFETAPLWMLIFMLLGSCVAFYNLYRASENLNSSPSDADSQLHPIKKDGKKTPNKK